MYWRSIAGEYCPDMNGIYPYCFSPALSPTTNIHPPQWHKTGIDFRHHAKFFLDYHTENKSNSQNTRSENLATWVL